MSYRNNAAVARPRARRAGFWRIVRWCLRGGRARLERARRRREALFGDVYVAIDMLPAGARKELILRAIRCCPLADERVEFYRRALSGSCTLCGATRFEPCDAGLHS